MRGRVLVALRGTFDVEHLRGRGVALRARDGDRERGLAVVAAGDRARLLLRPRQRAVIGLADLLMAGRALGAGRSPRCVLRVRELRGDGVERSAHRRRLRRSAPRRVTAGALRHGGAAAGCARTIVAVGAALVGRGLPGEEVTRGAGHAVVALVREREREVGGKVGRVGHGPGLVRRSGERSLGVAVRADAEALGRNRGRRSLLLLGGRGTVARAEARAVIGPSDERAALHRVARRARDRIRTGDGHIRSCRW